ncbi:MAG: HAD family hydrolase [Planctomycetia bacterium]
MNDHIHALIPKRFDYFVGVDSDGCTFDTMEVKHKECFIPNIIQFYNLAAVSKYVRAAAEFVNLYSVHRGVNRFPALVKTFDLVAEMPVVAKRKVAVPSIPAVRRWVATESKLGNPTLMAAAAGDAELSYLLEWSKACNATIEKMVHDVPPFPMVRESLAALQGRADVAVASATPTEALEREWAEHDLTKYVARICGQEVGSKKEILSFAKNYAPGRSLMVGDALGDYNAAVANGVLFFPVNPGAEDESWRRFHDEAIHRFFAGTYAGAYEAALLAEFRSYLPETPPWTAK